MDFSKLKKIHLFDLLKDEGSLKEIAALFEKKTYKAGEALTTEGAPQTHVPPSPKTSSSLFSLLLLLLLLLVLLLILLSCRPSLLRAESSEDLSSILQPKNVWNSTNFRLMTTLVSFTSSEKTPPLPVWR
jgi:hypothetical protein